MKKFFILAAVLLLSVLLATGISAADPYAYYSFDGDPEVDSAGGHNGENDGVTTAAGKVGNAGVFDGGSCIEIKTEDKLDKFTFACWFNPSSIWDAYHCLFAISQWTVPGTVHINVVTSGAIELGVSDAAFATRVTPTIFEAGNWYHFAVVYDPEAGVADYYVNGTLDFTSTSTSVPCAPVDLYDFFIGSWDFSRYYEGMIDELYIYNALLSADEIAALAGGAAPAAEAPTYTYPSSGEAGSIITGALIGNEAGWGDNADAGRAAACDGNPATFFDPLGVGDGYCGVDAGSEFILDKVAILPRDGQLPRYVGAMIQGSNDMENWTTLFTASAEPAAQEWQVTTEFENNTGYRYFRYFNETNHGDVAEVEFYGTAGTAGTAEAPAAVETPAATPAPAPAPVTTAPQTFDVIGVTLFVLAASFGAAVISKKK